MENVKNVCHDCGKKINKRVTLVYNDKGEKITIYKCQKCYKKNPSLANFRKCEVYSRVVGYLRPVDQWHEGKRREFKERKVYVQKGLS